MQIIETKVYTYDELSPKAQEKAREWYSDGNNMPFLSEYMCDYLAELLKENSLKCDDAKIMYSLSCSQGDGAMFEGRVYFTHDSKEYHAIVKHSGHYYHYNSKDIEIYDVEGDDVENAAHVFFNDVYVDICKKLAKAGYSYIDSENDAENIAENILANEYTFTEDGKRFG